MAGATTSDNNENSAKCQTDQFFREINLQFLIHELKDPLSVIETGILMLLEKQQLSGPLTVRQQKMLQRVLRSSRKVQTMVYELLEVGRAQADCIIPIAFNPCDLVMDVLTDVIEARDIDLYDQLHHLEQMPEKISLLSNHHINILFDKPSLGAEMIQDKAKFSLIVSNLLKNAFQYKVQTLIIRSEIQNQNYLVAIVDDGPGINSVHHEAVFERYRQVAPEGLDRKGHGLGLAMGRILARSMGGDVTLESEPGKGATFILSIPLTYLA